MFNIVNVGLLLLILTGLVLVVSLSVIPLLWENIKFLNRNLTKKDLDIIMFKSKIEHLEEYLKLKKEEITYLEQELEIYIEFKEEIIKPVKEQYVKNNIKK